MSQYQFSAPPISKTNKIILITSAVLFLGNSILRAVGAFDLMTFLGLSAGKFFSGFVFQLITYPFIESHLMSVIFNAMVVWFIGSELEQMWGARTYFRYLLINVLGVGLLFVLVNYLFLNGTPSFWANIYGLTGVNFAMLVAYAMLYPDRQMSLMMLFPMRARTFCWILIGIEFYNALISGLVSSWAHLLAMGISFLVIRFQSKPLIKKALNAGFDTRKRSKGHLYVVKDEDQKPPKFWQ